MKRLLLALSLVAAFNPAPVSAPATRSGVGPAGPPGAVGPTGPAGSGSSLGVRTAVATAAPFSADNTAVRISQEINIQAAHDSISTCGTGQVSNTQPGIVFLPSGEYQINGPIWLENGMTLQGEGREQTILFCRTGMPAIVIGHERRTPWLRTANTLDSLTGTVAVTNNSTAVVGTGTHFSTEITPYISVPVYFRNAGDGNLLHHYQVASVADDTHLTLTSIFNESTASGLTGQRQIFYLATIPTVFAADHRMDLWNSGTPKLDSSMVTAANQRWGITGKSPSSGSPWADHSIAFPFGLPSCGAGNPADHWEKTQGLVIDIAIEAFDGGPLTNNICGMGAPTPTGRPSPWWLSARTGDDSYVLEFFTSEGVRDSFRSSRACTFGHPSLASGVTRITVQVDFLNNTDGTTDTSAICDIHAWVNGVNQAVTRSYGTQLTTATGTEPSFTAGDNLHFAASSPFKPFTLFNYASDMEESAYPSLRSRDKVYGLRIDSVPKYTPGLGPQSIAAGGTLNDAYRYGITGATAGLVAALDTTQAPTADYQGKWVRMIGNVSTGFTHYGLFVPSFTDRALGGPDKSKVKDLTIMGHWGSANILVGPIIDMELGNLQLVTGADQVAIGGTFQSCYTTRVHDCIVGDGQWSSIAAWGWGGYLEHLTCNSAGGDCFIRLDGCGNIYVRDVTIGAISDSLKAAVMITGDTDYSSRYVVEQLSVDNEGAPAPSLGIIYCERHFTGMTRLYVRDITPGTIPPWVPIVKLVDNGVPNFNGRGAYGPGVANVSNIEGSGMLVQTDGPGWTGTIDGWVCPDISGFSNSHNHVGTDGVTNFLGRMRLTSLPTGGSHQKNGVTVEILQPGASANARYICSASGYGTWNSATVYPLNAMVWSGSSVYQATAANTNSAPPSANWTAVPVWDGATPYAAGALVARVSKVWQARAANTGVTPMNGPVQPGTYYSLPWVQVGTFGQALWAPLDVTGTPIAGP